MIFLQHMINAASKFVPKRLRIKALEIMNLVSLLRSRLSDPHARSIRKRLNSLYGKYKGQRCVIMGNGPSLNKMDLELFKRENVWGSNRCHLIYDRISWRHAFYVAIDARVVPDIAYEIDRLKADLPKTLFFLPYKFRKKTSIKPTGNLFWYNEFPLNESRLPDGMFAIDASRYLCAAYTVTIAAMQLAVYLGFNPIYLIGCDTSYSIPSTVRTEDRHPERFVSTLDDDPNHFDPRYFGKGRKWHHPRVERMIFHYKQAKAVCDNLGVNVYNATVGGELEVFPRVNYEEIFLKNA